MFRMQHQFISNKESSIPTLICVDIDDVSATDYSHAMEISSVYGPLSLRFASQLKQFLEA